VSLKWHFSFYETIIVGGEIRITCNGAAQRVLIPFNSFPGSHYNRPNLDTIEKFKEVLDTFKIPTLIRSAKGDDVLAACGQLNSKN